ncbi:MAG: right-handed parallel beta-helix repeat-containing protein, partial [Clostridia bacterium]|nr:right-handed parallel beta-helix repeat-containing protein [Clostridia bacterium]
MKNRILCALLTLCMLVALVPTALFPVSAETGSSQSASQNAGGKEAASYLDLYVGADGEATVNGGTMTVLLTAFKGQSSLDPSGGVWTNVANGATGHATLGGTWTAYAEGGVGYDLATFDNSYMLSLPASLLPTDTYTLEIVSSVRGLTENADGVTTFNKFSATANISLGRFRAFLFCGPLGTTDPYHTRYGNDLVTMYTEAASMANDNYYDMGAETNRWSYKLSLYRENTDTMSLTVALTASDTAYSYQFRHNGVDITPKNYYGCEKSATPYVGSFIINRAMPATYYAIRLYTKPLTELELAQNRAVDILLHAGVPFSVYQGVDDTDKKTFLSLVAEKDFTATAADIDGIVAELEAVRAVADAASKKTVYDELYVGANGSKTQNGGVLSILLSAYDNSSVVALEKSTVWYDKMRNYNATLQGSLWEKYEDGGIGYDLAAFDYSQALTIDPTALPLDTYTLEYIASVRGITRDADGVTAYNVYGATATISLGRFRGFLFCGPLGTSDPYHTRYANSIVTMFTESEKTATDNWTDTGGASGHWNTRLDAYRQDTSAMALSITLTETDTKYSYRFTKNGSDVTAATHGCTKGDTPYVGSFIVNRSMPGTIYAVRLYTKPLTEAELATNHFVDMMAYAGFDPLEYKNWDAETRAFVVDAMKESALLDKEAFDAALKDVLNLVVSQWRPENSLYVTDGLEMLLASYNGFSTAAQFNEKSVLWTNAVKNATFGTLVGRGWARAEDGGIRIRETIPQLSLANKKVEAYRREQNNDYYVNFDYSHLPEGDFTIESILDPEGLTVEDAQGNISLLYDDYSRYGIYTDRMFIVGPYRSIGWVCDTHSEGAGDLQHRWLYQESQCWNDRTDATRVKVGRDYGLGPVLNAGIINYTIAHDVFDEVDNDGMIASYTTSYNGKTGLISEIKDSRYMTKDEVVDKTFDMWRGLAATHYSIRIYNRLLTEDEKIQNHVADVCYYLDLDISMLVDTLSKIPDKATVFKAFAHLSFNMTKEEAQSALDNGMAGIWVGYDGVAFKNDMSDTLRFYFSLRYSSIRAIMQAGFAVELGALVNLNGEMPDLESGAYDYRFETFTSVAGAKNRYFLDEDTFALTLAFEDGGLDIYNQKLKIVSYVRLTAEDGTEMIFYGGFSGAAYSDITSFFTVMNYFNSLEDLGDDVMKQYVAATVDACYYEHTVHFNSHAEGKGDGSESAPYTDFTDAFEACNAVLTTLDRPTNVRLFVEGGTHVISEILTLDFDEITYPYYYYMVEGDYMADEAPELTTALPLSSADFAAVAGKDSLYVYQFAPDENGKYPAFRNLYVDGMVATRAHTTPITTADGERPLSFRYAKDIEGTYLNAKYYFEKGVLEQHAPSVEYASLSHRPDLIASYTKHYEWFLAYGDLKAAYNDSSVGKDAFAALTAEGVRQGMGEDYADGFAYFKEQYQLVYAGTVKAKDVTYEPAEYENKEDRPGLFYVQIEAVEPLRALVAQRLADLEASKDYWQSEVERRTGVIANKEAAYAAAKADYEAKLAAAGKADATDEEKVAYIAAKAVMEAAEAAVDVAKADLADAEWRIYDARSSFKICTRELGIEMHVAANWCFNIMDVDGIDFEDVVYYDDARHGDTEILVAVYLNKDQYQHFQIPPNNYTDDRLFSIQNALEFVDEEDEYYYDEAEGKLYYYTEGDILDLSFSRGALDNIFVFEDTKNFVLSDLTFWGTDYYEMSAYGIASNQGGGNKILQRRDYEISFTKKSVFTSWNTTNTVIRDCYFHDIGAAALYMEGRTEDLTISGNEFEEIGAHAIQIAPVPGVPGGSPEFSERSGAEGILITNNYLHDVATVSYAAPAITMPSTKDAELSYNTIMDCSYTGISIGWYYSPGEWEEHERYNLYNVNIHHNYITDFMQELGDGGAIYVLGGNLKPDNPKQVNFCHHNFVVLSKTTGNGMGELTNGYYYDGASSNWSNYNNICVNYSAGADRGKLKNASDADYHHYLSLSGSNMMFKQNHPQAISYNIHSYNNYFYNVRSQNASAAQGEAYHLHPSWKLHGHTITDCNYFWGNSKLSFSSNIKAQIEECGAYAHRGEWEWLLGN